MEISNRFLDSKYCPTNVLSKICDEYKIKCVLRYVDDKSGKVRIANENKPGKCYGPSEGYKYSVSLFTYKNHYFINEEVSINPFFIKNYVKVCAYGKLRNWTTEQMMKAYKCAHGPVSYTHLTLPTN